jgi:hypothetical protein
LRQFAQNFGIVLHRVPTLGTHPLLIESLVQLVDTVLPSRSNHTPIPEQQPC